MAFYSLLMSHMNQQFTQMQMAGNTYILVGKRNGSSESDQVVQTTGSFKCAKGEFIASRSRIAQSIFVRDLMAPPPPPASPEASSMQEADAEVSENESNTTDRARELRRHRRCPHQQQQVM